MAMHATRVLASRRVLFSVVALVLLIAIALFFALAPEGKSQQQNQQALAMPVELGSLSTGQVAESNEYVAIADALQSADIMPRVEAYISRVAVQPGQMVQKGQVLFLLDAGTQQASVNSAAAAIRSAQASQSSAKESLQALRSRVSGLEASLSYAQKQLARYEALSQTDAVSQQDYDLAQSQYEQAKSALATLNNDLRTQQAQIRAAGDRIQEAQAGREREAEQLSYYTIRAPFAGRVGDISMREGDYVTTSSELTHVTNLGKIDLEIAVPAEQSYRLRLGLPVQILSEEGKVLDTATISFIDPKVDASSQTVLVRAVYPNTKGLLRDKQRNKVRLVWETHTGLYVPTTAVQRTNGKAFVYVVKQAPANKQVPDQPPRFIAEQKAVTLGPIVGNAYSVEGGLNPKDRIVTGGIQKLQPGALVMDMAAMTPDKAASKKDS